MMEILWERGLTLSRRKTRIGSIQENFHYHEILHYFLAVCWDQRTAAVAAKLLFQGPTREVRSSSDGAMAFVAVSEKLGSQLAA